MAVCSTSAGPSPPLAQPHEPATLYGANSPRSNSSQSSLWSRCRNLAPGAVHGILFVLLGHPLDTIKTRMQTRSNYGTAGFSGTVRMTLRQEGVRGLYRGVGPPLLLRAAKHSVQFALWDALLRQVPRQQQLQHSGASSSLSTIRMRTIHSDDANDSGNRAEGTEQSVDSNAPRMRDIAISTTKRATKTSDTTVSTACVEDTNAHDSTASVITRSADDNNSSDSALSHGFQTSPRVEPDGPSRVHGTQHAFLAGAAAGAAGTLVSCPAHVIKIQTQCQTARDTSNAWACAVAIAQREGVRGFYRGMLYHIGKDACFAACYLGLYVTCYEEILRRVCRERASDKYSTRAASRHALPQTLGDSGSEESSDDSIRANSMDANSNTIRYGDGSSVTMSHAPAQALFGWGWVSTQQMSAFVAGCTAATLTWTLLFPLDTIKSLAQSGRLSHVWPTLRRSPRTVYRGWWAAMLRAGLVSGVAMMGYESTKMLVQPSTR